MINKVIGFIGAGNMSEAMIRGILRAKLVEPKSVLVSDVLAERLSVLAKNYSIQPVATNKELAQKADVLVLAIKPQVADNVAKELKGLVKRDALVISVMAGKTIQFLKEQIGVDHRYVRVMPNTPALIGYGMAALAKSTNVTSAESQDAEKIFQALGAHTWVDESAMNAVTAVSGSGPAYIFLMAEAMIGAAQKQGLSLEQANMLVKQTIVGAAQMMVVPQAAEPAVLRAQVTSPGGTTEAALKEFERRKFAEIVEAAIDAAKRRADELAKGK